MSINAPGVHVPNLKVGKTDVIGYNGNRVVTETTQQKLKNGNSIWTINEKIDEDHDGKFDMESKQTYELEKSGKLVRTSLKSEWSDQETTYSYDGKVAKQVTKDLDYGSRTETIKAYYSHNGKLAKEIEKSFDRDNNLIDEKVSIHRDYFDGQHEIEETYSDGRRIGRSKKTVDGVTTEVVTEYDGRRETRMTKSVNNFHVAYNNDSIPFRHTTTVFDYQNGTITENESVGWGNILKKKPKITKMDNGCLLDENGLPKKQIPFRQ